MSEYRVAFNLGSQARMEGLLPADNPFRGLFIQKRMAWVAGWAHVDRYYGQDARWPIRPLPSINCPYRPRLNYGQGKPRKCNVCYCRLEPDEHGSYCPDCAPISAVSENPGSGNKRVPGQEERIVNHSERVERELASLSETRTNKEEHDES